METRRHYHAWPGEPPALRPDGSLWDHPWEFEEVGPCGPGYAGVAYLGGPMRGKPRWNYDAFERAELDLRAKGWTIFSPREHDIERGVTDPPEDGGPPPEGFLSGQLGWDFERIAESSCVILLPGWETSTGVHWELTVAYALGKPAFQYPEMTPVAMPEVVTQPVIAQADVLLAAEQRIPMPTRAELDDVLDGRTGEVRVVDPTTGGEKGAKLARFDLLPWDVLYELAEHFGRGSQKYEDRNWEKGYKWSLSIAALCRHLAAWLTREDDDPETGSSHLIAVAWHALALRWFQKHGKGTDDRPR